MSVVDLIKLIADVGAIPVCLGVIIYFVVLDHLQVKKDHENHTAAIAEQDKRLDTLSNVIEVISQNTKHTHSHEEEENNKKTNLIINRQLSKLLESTNANRICCFLYHNGGYSVNGRSFSKMSILFEQVDGNTAPVMNSFQNVPRMMFPILVEKLGDAGCYYIKDIADIKREDALTYQSMIARGTKSAYIMSIYDVNKNVIGFVSVEYSTNKCEDEEYLKTHLLSTVIRVGGALESNSELSPNNNGGGNKE